MTVWHPNLIVPGVAKCGTTTLHDLLVQHPRITGGIYKELRFLMDEDDPLRRSPNVHSSPADAYRGLYPDRGEGDFEFWLDASPQYQYQRSAIEFISRIERKPFVVFILRDPADRLYSLYQYARYHQRVIPRVNSFEEFIAELRPPTGKAVTGMRMLENAWEDTHYDRCIERWRKVVPSDKLTAISLEELTLRPVVTLTKLSLWLGIDPEPFGSLNLVPASNRTVIMNSRFLRTMQKIAGRWLPRNYLTLKVKAFVEKLNSREIDPSERSMNKLILEQLREEFRPSLERLHIMTGLRLGFIDKMD